MSDINFHQPYLGREDNKYTFLIQKLYNYQYTLQEITKELQKNLKQMPEYKNKNKANINLEINKLTTNVSFNPKDSNKILKNVTEKKAKTENIYLFNLVAARKILLERIPILESYIESLPVPQNSNDEESNNDEQNYFKSLAKSKPKLKTTKNMTEKEKIKAQRKGAEKLLSKKYKETNLVKNTYLTNKILSNEFIKNAIDKEESELEEERLHQFLLNVDPEYRRQFENSSNNNGNYGPSVDNNNINNYNRCYNRCGPTWVSTVNGLRFPLTAREARAYNDGNFNQISVPFQSYRRSNSNLSNSSNSENNSNLTNGPRWANSSNSENNIFPIRSNVSSRSTNSSNSENNLGLTNSLRSLKHPTKFFSNEESNSGYESNKFLGSRHKRTDKNKSKRRILKLKHLE
jgi:hypothetical protein